jgi:hypothetical protein
MARRAGGYKRSDPTEWAECSRQVYGEAIVSANAMGQDVYTWMNDAIQHHAYRCELIQCKERYAADLRAAHETNGISPMEYEERYQPTRKQPTITRSTGQGSGPTGRGYKP